MPRAALWQSGGMDTAPQNPAQDTARHNSKGHDALSGSQFFRLAHRLFGP